MNLTENDKKMIMSFLNTYDNSSHLRQQFRNRNAEHYITNNGTITIPYEWKDQLPVNSVHVRVYSLLSGKKFTVDGDKYTIDEKVEPVYAYEDKQFVSSQMFYSEDTDFTNYEQTVENAETIRDCSNVLNDD